MKLVCQRIPREQLERVYHITLPRSPEDPPNAAPSPRQLLKVSIPYHLHRCRLTASIVDTWPPTTVVWMSQRELVAS